MPKLPKLGKVVVKVNLDHDLAQFVVEESVRRHCSQSQVLRDLVVELKSRREGALS